MRGRHTAGRHAAPGAARRRRVRHLVRWLAGTRRRRVALASGAALVAAAGVAVGLALSAARGDLLRARADLRAARLAMVADDGPAAEAAFDRADDRIASARARARAWPLAPLAPVPLLGSATSALLDVTRASDEVVAAGRVLAGARAGFPVSSAARVSGRDLSAFHQASVASTAGVGQAARHLRSAGRALEGPVGAALPPISGLARKMRAELRSAQRQLDGFRRGLEVLARLSDPDADARLLVLSQDSLELRPAGGYIGSFGVLRFAAGSVHLERYEATDVLPAPQPPMEPPGDLARWLPRWWGLSNVNWWPHFPTTAAAAREMFRRQGGGEVQGVLALTEHAVARLVGVFEPLAVPGYAEPVVAEGFDRRVLHELELKRPLDEPRKRFLTELSTVLFARLLEPAPGQVPAVARAVGRSVGAGDIQVWFADPELQALVAPTAWSGRVPRTDGDFVMLVDANLSGSKANLDLVKDARYEVHRRDDGWLRARLDIAVTNRGEPHPDLNPYYNGFLRLYLPPGARVPEPGQGQRLDGAADDGPYQVVSQVLDVEPLGRQDVVFEYWLPPEVAPGGDYRLTWLRQPGTGRDRLVAVVGGRTVRADPADRSLEVRADLGGNAVADFLRRRWIVRKAGDLLSAGVWTPRATMPYGVGR